MNVPAILEEVVNGYELDWSGFHGLLHWGRVLDNGLRLAESTGANETVVTLFALFHDARRVSDGSDPGHGRRGVEYAATLRGRLFEVSRTEWQLLREACELHTEGLTDADVTVQTCWDADRLDLGRVGIRPRRSRLCTDAARDHRMIEWAHRRATAEEISETVRELWLSLARGR